VGLLSWLKGAPKTSDDKRTRWIRKAIERATVAEALDLTTACAALGGSGAMAFGMVVAEVPGRDQLRDLALERLRGFVPELADNQCDAVFDIVDRLRLPIDLEARRTRLIADRAAALENATSRLRTMLAEAAAGPLVDACGALRGFQHQVMGVTFQGDEALRRDLLAQGLARLEALIPTLSDDAFEDVYAVIRRANLPIDVSARRATVTDRRRAKQAEAIAAASGTEPRNDELEAAIDASPDDSEPSSVLADWLADRGHPRGELVALQLRAESDPALKAAADAHLAAHASALLGPLAPHQRTHDGEDREAFVWRRGFIDHARLSNDDNTTHGTTTVAEILGLLFAHPSGRRLTRVDVGINGGDDGLDDVIEVIAGGGAPPTLRALLLGDYIDEQRMISYFEVGRLAPLWRVTSLRELVVHGVFDVGTIDHPLVEHVEFQTGGLSPASAEAIAVARWPRLRHLDIWYGDPNYGGDATIVDVRPLLARTDLPELVHLGLKNAAFTDEICGQLATSPLMPQLRELDLSLGTMSDAGAEALAAAAEAFPKLARLDVSDNYLGDAAIAMLRRAFPAVALTTGAQRDGDEDDRFPSVGE